MSIKDKAKNKAKKQVKKIAFKVLKPFLPLRFSIVKRSGTITAR